MLWKDKKGIQIKVGDVVETFSKLVWYDTVDDEYVKVDQTHTVHRKGIVDEVGGRYILKCEDGNCPFICPKGLGQHFEETQIIVS